MFLKVLLLGINIFDYSLYLILGRSVRKYVQNALFHEGAEHAYTFTLGAADFYVISAGVGLAGYSAHGQWSEEEGVQSGSQSTAPIVRGVLLNVMTPLAGMRHRSAPRGRG